MRADAAAKISANPGWGATKETNNNDLYKIIDSENEVRLRYEIDTVLPVSSDTDSILKTCKRKNNGPNLPVHYGLFVEVDCGTKHNAAGVFLGGFKSQGEADHAMKQSARLHIHMGKKAKLYYRSIEILGEQGELLQRYAIENGKRDGDGRFIKEEDWVRMRDHGGNMQQMGGRVPILRLPDTPEIQKLRASRLAQLAASQEAPPVQPLATLQPRADRTARQQSPRVESLSEHGQVAQEEPATESNTNDQVLEDSNPYCTCHRPDDGTFMVLCDNDKCPIKWYHGRCVGIGEAPPDDEPWYYTLCWQEQEHTGKKTKEKISGKTAVKKVSPRGGKPKGKATKRRSN